VRRILRATVHSWNGLRAIAASEAAFRQEILLLLVSVPLAFLIAQDNWKRLALIALIMLVMVVELLNTAIEKLCDRLTREREPEIRAIKDMGSAAVGLSLLMAGFFWILALCERVAGWL
jgi:diacylglycerol kinase (ATP)